MNQGKKYEIEKNSDVNNNTTKYTEDINLDEVKISIGKNFECSNSEATKINDNKRSSKTKITSLKEIEIRASQYEKNEAMIPADLDQEIEQEFTNSQQTRRLVMFRSLLQGNMSLSIEKAQKKQSHSVHTNYRGSPYRGVSKNGKSW